MTVKEIKIGIIGFGTVGAGVAANILANSDVIASRAGVKLVLAKVAALDITTDRGVRIPEGVLTTDAAEAIREADIVVELVGGTTVAKKFILDAIRAGKPVVTANKALLALHGEEIFSAAEAAELENGTNVIVNAAKGEIVVNPSEDEIAAAEAAKSRAAAAKELRGKPGATFDGHLIPLLAYGG